MNCAFQKYILRHANVRKYIDNYTALLQVDISLPIRGMFVLRCGLRFSFRDPEVPEPIVGKGSFSLTKMLLISWTPIPSLLTEQLISGVESCRPKGLHPDDPIRF